MVGVKIDQGIKDAFQKVKSDMNGLYHVILELKDRQDKQESQLVSIKSQLVSVLSQKSLNNNEPTNIKESQSSLSFVSEKSHNGINKSQSSLNKSLNNKSHKIEDKVMRRLRRTKKQYIVTEIRQLIEEMKDIPDIKYIVVDEKGLCSKASFYRYVKTLSLNKSLINSLNKVS